MKKPFSKDFSKIHHSDTIENVKTHSYGSGLWNTYYKNTLWKLDCLIDRALYIKNKKISGNVAEVGIAKGGSAKILANIFLDKKIHLFDTFQGLPIEDPLSGLVIGDFHENEDDAKLFLSNNDNVEFNVGKFPDTVNLNSTDNYCFVHLDVDTYQSTMDGLIYFYPRLTNQGYILIDDYMFDELPGVTMAVLEFTKLHDIKYHLPERWMCLIQKT
jgi:hypothetical protein